MEFCVTHAIQDLLRAGFGRDAHFADRLAVHCGERRREGRFAFFGQEFSFYRPVFLFIESLDQAFAFHDESDGDALHAAGRKSVAHFAPEKRGEFITHEPVQHAPCLLGIHKIDIQFARMFKRAQNRVFRDLVEGDAFRFFLFTFLVQFKRLDQVPGDRFSFAVFVSRENDAVRLFGELFQIVHDRFGFLRDDIGRLKVMLDINADLALRQIADMAIRRFNDKIFADEFADRFGLGG